jgi:hypothetical protein
LVGGEKVVGVDVPKMHEADVPRRFAHGETHGLLAAQPLQPFLVVALGLV